MVLFSMILNDPNPNFKVMPLFNAEYLRNSTRYGHNYNELLVGAYALLKRVIYLRQRRRYMFLSAHLSSFVCLCARLLKKCEHGFGWNIECRQMSGHGRTDYLLSPIRIIVRMPELDSFLHSVCTATVEFYYVRKIPCTYWYWGKVEAATRGFEASKDRCRR